MDDIIEILGVKKQQLIDLSTLKSSKQKSTPNFRIPSGSNNFNNVLGGGFSSAKMYLLFGANRTGKTQLCHQLCVQAYKQVREVANKHVTFYLDLENTFRPERIKEIANALELDHSNVFQSILVSKITSNSALQMKLKEIEETIKSYPPRLLIIDSINVYYRLEQGDKNIPSHISNNTFIKILEKIKKLTMIYNVVTLLTAQVAPNFNGAAPFIKDIPVGNILLNHYISEYIYLAHKEEDIKYIHLVNSENLPEKKVVYKITTNGIEDYKYPS